MRNKIIHNKRIVLFAIALLFSLTPCKVKASLFESFGFIYEQTLNQSKVSSSCNSSSFTTQNISTSKSTSVVVPDFPTLISSFLAKKIVAKQQNYSKVISIKSLPKYLLYKQFKFDVV